MYIEFVDKDLNTILRVSSSYVPKVGDQVYLLDVHYIVSEVAIHYTTVSEVALVVVRLFDDSQVISYLN